MLQLIWKVIYFKKKKENSLSVKRKIKNFILFLILGICLLKGGDSYSLDYLAPQSFFGRTPEEQKPKQLFSYKIFYENNIPAEVVEAVEEAKDIIDIIMERKGLKRIDVRELEVTMIPKQGKNRYVFHIAVGGTDIEFVGKISNHFLKTFMPGVIAQYQEKMNRKNGGVFPEVLGMGYAIVFEEFIKGPTYEKLVEEAATLQEKRVLLKEFTQTWLRLWKISEGQMFMDAKLGNVIKSEKGPIIIDVEEPHYIGPFSLLWHVWNHMVMKGVDLDFLLEIIVEYFGEEAIDFIKQAIIQDFDLDLDIFDKYDMPELKDVVLAHDHHVRQPYAYELKKTDLVDFLEVLTLRRDLQHRNLFAMSA